MPFPDDWERAVIASLFFGVLGVMGVALFYMGEYPPIAVSVGVMALATICLCWVFYYGRVGALTMLLYAVFTLPFIHTVPYLWFDFGYAHPDNLWGLAVNPYMLDRTIIELTAMIGAVGVCGFATGCLSLSRKVPTATQPGYLHSDPQSGQVFRAASGVNSLSMPFFLAWLGVGVLCTWLSAPQQTIFTAAYTHSVSISQNWNFSALWMVSYAFVIYAFSDALLDTLPKRARQKRWLVICAVLLIVIWFQLLRGDRESLTLAAAVVLMYYMWAKGFNGTRRWKENVDWKMIGTFVFVVFATSFFIGYFRSAMTSVSGVDTFVGKVESMPFDHFISGTWSAVLLGPLSVAGDYLNGKLSLQYGQTYLDLLASSVPGFVADWIGYVRPISGLRGPAWQMTYGIGGTHAVVVPFLNFSMAGVFMIVALWSCALAAVERFALRRFSQTNLALLGMIAMASAHWLWYGEKNIMNAVMLWFVLSLLYRFRIDAIRQRDPALAGQ